jgi:ubiquitin-conjugating enzyme E2 N
MTDSPPGISAAPNNDNLRHFDVTVTGPESSPYEGELGAGQC